MTLRTAVPGLSAGVAGLTAGVVGLVVDQPLLGLAAGGLAAAAGAANLVVARRLEDQMALHALAETGLQPGQLLAEAAVAPATDSGAQPVVEPPSTVSPPTGDPGDPTLVDRETGLFTETFFHVALESRIAAARRHLRPIAVVLLDVVEGLGAGKPSPAEVGVVSTTIRTTLREADTACRLRNGYYALLLEDTPENGAIWTVERLRRQLAEVRPGLTVWAGLACYPAHAFSPAEILEAAERALVSAREWRQDRIEVAVAAD